MKSRVETFLQNVVIRGVYKLSTLHRQLLPLPKHPHPFLTGLHTPMHTELTLENLPISGVIPSELTGRYCRIGPNPVSADPRSHHWFLGDGMIHAVGLQAGRACWYRNRWIHSKHISKAKGIAAAPGPRRGASDTVNTNIIGQAGSTWALNEATSTPVRLNELLDEQAYDDFGGTLAGTFAPHPHRDPATGELHAIAYDARELDRIRYVIIDVHGKVRRELPIPVEHGPAIHDCALTARYILILDLPLTFSFPALFAGFVFPFRWNRSHQARVGLLPREGAATDVLWIDIDPCFIFHTVNAFDLHDGRIALDAVVYDHVFVSASRGPDTLPRGLKRWTIDPDSRTVECRTLSARPQEFPRINERRIGLPYRYAYSLGLEDQPAPEIVQSSCILKHDLHEGTTVLHDFGAGCFPGEFVFVPRSNNTHDEDAGWLMGLVVNSRTSTTDLAILDAQRMEAEPVAAVHIPHRIPLGFHGSWIAA